MDFRTFLKSKRKLLGISQNKFSKLVGITQSYYNGIERGEIKNPPSDEIVEKIITALVLSPEEANELKYLVAMEKTPSIILEQLENLKEENKKTHQKAVFQQDEVMIPLYSRISAGSGAITDEEPEDYISIPGIRNVYSMFAVNVFGDSMEPTIQNRSIILCSDNAEIRDGDVAAFIVNGESYVKRLKRNDEYIALLSDNPRYKPIYISSYDDFRVVGKVLKVINDVY